VTIHLFSLEDVSKIILIISTSFSTNYYDPCSIDPSSVINNMSKINKIDHYCYTINTV